MLDEYLQMEDMLRTLANTQGLVTIDRGVLTFEDGTALDLTTFADKE